MVAVVDLSEVRRSDLLQLFLRDVTVEVQVAVCDPLCEAKYTTLITLWESVEEDMVAVDCGCNGFGLVVC